jgi:uncharacterized membrane protein
LAWFALQVDFELAGADPIWWLNQSNGENASALLSSLLGSLITMATLVVSITMVVLTLAAGQLGPRIIRIFMADRRTQAVLGLFIATIIYVLLILRLLDTDLSRADVPHFAVTAGTVLVLLCVFTLLFYLHHLARSIIADNVIERVGQELDRSIIHYLPGPASSKGSAAAPAGVPAVSSLPRSGYVQAVDYQALACRAAERDCCIALDFRPGTHLLANRQHARIWPAEAFDEELRDAIAAAVVIGHERTSVQDVELGFRQMVEVALRALSPGINDPFTAIAAVDRITASLALLMRHGEPQGIWRDDAGIVRLTAPSSTFAGVADVAFNQIRQASSDHPAVMIRMLEALATLVEPPATEAQIVILERHAELIASMGQRVIAEGYDLAALQERAARLRETIGRGLT